LYDKINCYAFQGQAKQINWQLKANASSNKFGGRCTQNANISLKTEKNNFSRSKHFIKFAKFSFFSKSNQPWGKSTDGTKYSVMHTRTEHLCCTKATLVVVVVVFEI
jgi:hypothetical protein